MTLLRLRMPSRVQLFTLLLGLGLALPAPAADASAGARQNPAVIKRAVEDHLRRETRGLPGSATFKVGPVEERLNLPACPALETFPAPGARPWGSSSVGVRCLGAERWSIYVPVEIQVYAEYFVTARPLGHGQLVGAQDIVAQQGELSRLPAGVVTNAEAAIGRRMGVSLAAGQPLRQDMLRLQLLILQGQPVKLVSRGSGFQVSAEGRAVTSAHEGQVVQVRTPSGQVLSGIARPGPLVEVHSGG